MIFIHISPAFDDENDGYVKMYFIKREVLKHGNKEITGINGESTQKKVDER